MTNKLLKPQTAIALLADSKQTGHLLRMLNQQQSLLEQIQTILPSPLGDHCLHARISNHQLILHTDSSAWMTRLRFHGPQLLKALQPQIPHLQTVKTRVLISSPIRHPRRNRRKISPQSAASIQEMALSVSHNKLRAALLRLSQTGNDDQVDEA